MLVLSRKVDQRIQIGEDITITVVRVEGNRVRIGIDAPRDQRIVRGELEPIAETVEFELSDREFAFAHPQDSTDVNSPTAKRSSGRHESTSSKRAASTRAVAAKKSAGSENVVVSGKVSTDGSKVQLNTDDTNRARRSPLASFVSAS
ncbi:carbon storage regulator [Roseiconus lacunae]|uniref:Translational regulator CsrA n=1 Tax=Roseiconus lacunae TaxID=2605694 RepID=A0ABT7PL62_9BACT|nr:carbon storage regulator [Roseiconus lacunae]MDM4017247.1 carbon storage regulator [Roseiconus lacunae]